MGNGVSISFGHQMRGVPNDRTDPGEFRAATLSGAGCEIGSS
jgi:hypothetical protein